ncbi:MAG: TRAP transporter small permease subunit [Robiginitomaculum sp.]|nr:TRAP transporter small permease subunit [Robiginitomaculum sp.]
MSNLNFYWILLAFNPLVLMAIWLLVSTKWQQLNRQSFIWAGKLVVTVDRFNEILIEIVKWFALAMVLLTAALVVGRYVFGVGSLKGQEAVIYMHGALFLFAAGATLLHNGHVRVDVFFSRLNQKQKSIIDILGSFFFLIPMCLTILIVSQSFIATSWQVLEGSPEADGLQLVYLLKTTIPAFAILMLFQGSAQILRGTLQLIGQPLPAAKAVTELI